MQLADFPSFLRSAVAAVPEERLRTRAHDGSFALIEHAWHLADLETEGYGLRIERLLSEPHPHFADFDGGAIAEARRYLALPLEPALERFAESRARNLERLSRSTSNVATQDGVEGEITLERIATMMREHDAAHAAEIEALLAELGVRVIASEVEG